MSVILYLPMVQLPHQHPHQPIPVSSPTPFPAWDAALNNSRGTIHMDVIWVIFTRIVHSSLEPSEATMAHWTWAGKVCLGV